MNILVIAPHPDDEVLGCGGTIAKYAAHGSDVYVAIVTRGTSPMFSEKIIEAGRAECRKADSYLGVRKTMFMDFPAARMEEVSRHDLNGAFIELIQKIKPDIVYLPHRGDMQLDHKMTVDAAMVALRPKYKHVVSKVLAYETVSETGWDIPNTINEFIPNVYNDITGFLDKKIKALSIFESQIAEYPNARSLNAVEALAVYRGTTVGTAAAEAFNLIREIQAGSQESADRIAYSR